MITLMAKDLSRCKQSRLRLTNPNFRAVALTAAAPFLLAYHKDGTENAFPKGEGGTAIAVTEEARSTPTASGPVSTSSFSSSKTPLKTQK